MAFKSLSVAIVAFLDILNAVNTKSGLVFSAHHNNLPMYFLYNFFSTFVSKLVYYPTLNAGIFSTDDA